jgi:transmembrane sensor
MSISPEQLHYLLLQYANNNCSPKELHDLLQAIEEARHDDALHHSLLHIWQNISHADQLPDIDKEVLFSNIIAAAPVHQSRSIRYTWLKVAAAAIIVLALGRLAYIYLGKEETLPKKSIVQLTPFKSEKAALTGKAILSLANGKEIVLDDAPIGTLARLGGTAIIKRNNRQLVYAIDRNGTEVEEAQFNTYHATWLTIRSYITR